MLVHHNPEFYIFLIWLSLWPCLDAGFHVKTYWAKRSYNGKCFCCQLFCRVKMMLLRVNKARVQTVAKDLIHCFRVIQVQFIQPLLALLGILFCRLQQIWQVYSLRLSFHCLFLSANMKVFFCFLFLFILFLLQMTHCSAAVRLWSTKLNANLVCYKGHNYPVWDVQV